MQGNRKEIMVERKALKVEDYNASYLSAGTEAKEGGRVWLLLHGLAGSANNWSGFLSYAEKYFPDQAFLALDILGHGESDSPEVRYSIGMETDFVISFLKTLKVNRVSLMGNSMGGWISMEVSKRFPTDSLVLVDTGGIPGSRPRGLQPKTTAEAKRLLSRIFCDAAWYSDEIAEKLVKSRRGRLGHVVEALLKSEGVPLSWGQIASIDKPTLIIWGSCDRLIPLSRGRALSRAITGSTMITIERLGHEPMLEDPLKFVRAVGGWIVTSREV